MSRSPASIAATWNGACVRQQFPALARQVAGRQAVFWDGPAGSQVPQRVIDAVGRCLIEANANLHGGFETSREAGERLASAQSALADFVGSPDPESIVFGANTTSLAFAASRAIAKTWKPGDEVVVTELDHDANVAPWMTAAADAGATIRTVRLRPEDGTLDLDDLQAKLNERTRLVAFTAASNALGTLTPVAEICRRIHDAGAVAWVDAVHAAPHVRLDAADWNCDFLACSAYKFFGPHVGVMYARPELLAEYSPYKVRPAPNTGPERWMNGTQPLELICGAAEAIEYLADLGRQANPAATNRSGALDAAWQVIGDYERTLAGRLLEGLAKLSSYRVEGLSDLDRLDERTPTVAVTHESLTARTLAERLAERGVFAWDGNFYALNTTTALGLEPDGVLRLGMLHYNTTEEVDYVLGALAEIG